MEAAIIVLLSVIALEGLVLILRTGKSGVEREEPPAGEKPAVSEKNAEKQAREYEKRWNEGIQNILGYSAESAKKAVRDYAEGEE